MVWCDLKKYCCVEESSILCRGGVTLYLGLVWCDKKVGCDEESSILCRRNNIVCFIPDPGQRIVDSLILNIPAREVKQIKSLEPEAKFIEIK
jgi:hypothetical protein